MAWRIADSVVRGEIDNRLPKIIKGTLYVEGLKEPVTLELEGNCEPDLAGRHLTFRNLMPVANMGLEGFSVLQCGEAGSMTANRMVRLPTISQEEVDRCLQERKSIPTRWSESLFLEWFSCNGRVLIEGASFACQLSPAKWKLREETYQWIRRLKERAAFSFLSDEPKNGESAKSNESSDEPDIQSPFHLKATDANRLTPHPVVRRATDFLLQLIYETRQRKFYTAEAIENQPLEGMIDATAKATVRLADTMAKVARLGHAIPSHETVHGLKQARWSLAQAAENAGLAHYMGSADLDWLDGLRRDFSEMRKEILYLVREYEEQKTKPSPARETAAAQTTS